MFLFYEAEDTSIFYIDFLISSTFLCVFSIPTHSTQHCFILYNSLCLYLSFIFVFFFSFFLGISQDLSITYNFGGKKRMSSLFHVKVMWWMSTKWWRLYIHYMPTPPLTPHHTAQEDKAFIHFHWLLIPQTFIQY